LQKEHAPSNGNKIKSETLAKLSTQHHSRRNCWKSIAENTDS